MKKKTRKDRPVISALKVSQWLDGWSRVDWDAREHRRKPEEHFYVFSLSARQLRTLSGVNRRSADGGGLRSDDLGIQRSHEDSRSKSIAKYVKYGYPWSDLTDSQRKDKKFHDLRKPGWLPTAIVVNILAKEDKRQGGKKVTPEDLVTVKQIDDVRAEIILPSSFYNKKKTWEAKTQLPIEIIDGQHRLLAFDDPEISDDYQLPVVAFHGLDISWQAYLFWSVNIKPKRINPSLAFDLYPLLRTEKWLEHFEGHKVYREARAQELVEILWSEPSSAWHQRVNMLGESGGPAVSQAAWVRALLKTYVKSFEGKGVMSIGGLFGAPSGKDEIVLPWNRAQQAALIIYLWNEIKLAVKKTKLKWAVELRDNKKQQYTRKITDDPAFAGPATLLNNDQGISVILNVSNDLLFKMQDELDLQLWRLDPEIRPSDALKNLESKQKKIAKFVSSLAKSLAGFDWRSSAARGLRDEERIRKLSFRGGSGYKEFRRQILKFLFDKKEFSKAAKEIYEAVGLSKDDV